MGHNAKPRLYRREMAHNCAYPPSRVSTLGVFSYPIALHHILCASAMNFQRFQGNDGGHSNVYLSRNSNGLGIDAGRRVPFLVYLYMGQDGSCCRGWILGKDETERGPHAWEVKRKCTEC